MRALAAPDKFRGTLTAAEAAEAMAQGARRAGWECTELPLADGGEGTLDALGGANRQTAVTGPLGEAVEAGWRLDGKLAVIEMARASGLALAGGREANDPLEASTYGTGELIAAALREGASRVIVCVGGSATTDGGAGALAALDGLVPFTGAAVSVACDVQTGFLDAARVFGPQKGADAGQVAELTARLARRAQEYRERFGVDVKTITGSGAAGGLAGGLAAAGARLMPGFALVADLVGLDDALSQADVVLTGEGHLDATSFQGKVVGGVCERASALGVRAIAVAGRVDPDVAGRLPACSLVELFGDERALADTAVCVELAVAAAL